MDWAMILIVVISTIVLGLIVHFTVTIQHRGMKSYNNPFSNDLIAWIDLQEDLKKKDPRAIKHYKKFDSRDKSKDKEIDLNDPDVKIYKEYLNSL